MDFTRRKLSKEAMDQLYRIRVDSVKPFALMSAPVYLWLGANEKFISLKAPFDFFTAEELEKIKAGHRFLYLPPAVRSLLPFRNAGLQVRALIRPKRERPKAPDPKTQYPWVGMTPAPYELSNEVLKIIGPLWWEYSEDVIGVEPFLVSIFVNELCSPLPNEKLLTARETNTDLYDHALLCSSFAVFIALHLGNCEYSFLNSLRLLTFERVISGASGSHSGPSDLNDLIRLAIDLLGENPAQITNEALARRSDLISQRVSGRLERVLAGLAQKGDSPPTVYGEGGFINA